MSHHVSKYVEKKLSKLSTNILPQPNTQGKDKTNLFHGHSRCCRWRMHWGGKKRESHPEFKQWWQFKPRELRALQTYFSVARPCPGRNAGSWRGGRQPCLFPLGTRPAWREISQVTELHGKREKAETRQLHHTDKEKETRKAPDLPKVLHAGEDGTQGSNTLP